MAQTRRSFLRSAAATVGVLSSPTYLWAQSRISLGDVEVISLSDGNLTLPADFIFGPMPQDELGDVLKPFGVSPTSALTPPCNVTLMKDQDRVILFDVGSGSSFQPSAGKLVDALDAVNLTPDDVTHVVFTHAHPDHLWGALDDFDDPLFVNAEHMISQGEMDYWMDPDTVNTIGDARTAFAIGAKRRLETLEDSLTVFKAETEVLPGIYAHNTPGHTPGHCAFELRSGNSSLMVLGDAIGNHHVAFARPEWRSGSDQNLDLAAQTRVQLLDKITTDNMQLIGFHLAGNGMGYSEKTADGYRFLPLG